MDENNNIIISQDVNTTSSEFILERFKKSRLTIDDLPYEVIEYILSFLSDPISQRRAARVCQHWRYAIQRLRWVRLLYFERKLHLRLPFAGSLHEVHGNKGFSLLLSVDSPVLFAGAGIFLPHRDRLEHDLECVVELVEHGVGHVGPVGPVLANARFRLKKEMGLAWQHQCNSSYSPNTTRAGEPEPSKVTDLNRGCQGCQTSFAENGQILQTNAKNANYCRISDDLKNRHHLWQSGIRENGQICLQGPWQRHQAQVAECKGLHPFPVMFDEVVELTPHTRYLLTLQMMNMKGNSIIQDMVGTVWGFQGVPRRKQQADQNHFRWFQVYRPGLSSSVSSGQFPIIYYIA